MLLLAIRRGPAISLGSMRDLPDQGCWLLGKYQLSRLASEIPVETKDLPVVSLEEVGTERSVLHDC